MQIQSYVKTTFSVVQVFYLILIHTYGNEGCMHLKFNLEYEYF